MTQGFCGFLLLGGSGPVVKVLTVWKVLVQCSDKSIFVCKSGCKSNI